MADVPAWKKAILDKKKKKDIDEEQKRKEEEEKLAQLPAWKRSLLLRKQMQDTGGGSSSPPLSRAGFAAKRKENLLRADSVTSPTTPTEPAGNRGRSDSSGSLPSPTTVISPRQFPPSVKSPVSPVSPQVESPSTPSSQTQENETTTTTVNRPRSESAGSDDGGDRPNVRQLMGMFKKKDDSGEAVKRPGSAEKRRGQFSSNTHRASFENQSVAAAEKPSTPKQDSVPAAKVELAAAKPPQSSIAPATTPTKPANISVSQPQAADQADGPKPSTTIITGEEGEEDDEVTNIDDIVVDAQAMAKLNVSPGRVAGVESMPTSPTFKKAGEGRGRRGSCLVSPNSRKMTRGRRSVSFSELNLETVHTFEREPSSDEEEEEEEVKRDEPDRGPRASSGLRSVPTIGAKKDDSQPSGFQAFKPRALAEPVAESPSAEVEIAMPSWRQQATTPKKKEEPSPEPQPAATESDLKVEDLENEPALLW